MVLGDDKGTHMKILTSSTHDHAWKSMIPLALFNMLVTGVLILMKQSHMLFF